MKYLMPDHLDNGFTHCALQPESLWERIRLWVMVHVTHKDRFKVERGSTFAFVDTKWLMENTSVGQRPDGVIDA